MPRAALALLVATALCLPPAPAAQAAEPAETSRAGTAAPVRITLITGDVVGFSAPRTIQLLRKRPGIRYDVISRGDDWYLLPSDARTAIAAGTVDESLFNVSYLAANGYADAATLPVLLDYGTAVAPATARTKADALPATTAARALPSARATAVSVAKSGAGALWKSVTHAAGPRVRLDRRVKVALHDSVAQIGAPQAWAAGYDGKGVRVAILDTGIDAGHPDLAGKVATGRSFVAAEPDLTDRNGHGTHVASTVAGSGAASGGREKGVAPGAELIVGKVLDGGGSGFESDIIAAMEWAATEADADVISMSLGGTEPANGPDLMAAAVDSLAARTGALFVIAAGNSGPETGTVSTPGIAAAALTVGAVDGSDAIASFSGRGPSQGGVVKPEIVAPGVDIAAARAAGTSMGQPVDQYYTRASGTSMATPHVAGAAAILAQRHPDWTAERLKSTLVGSAKDLAVPVGGQGAGRADVPAALAATVTATPAAVSLGVLPAPQTGSVDATVAYRNDGAGPVTLTVSSRLTDPGGKPVPAGTLTVPATITVPAGGTASLTAVVQPGKVPAGSYQGLITATDGTVHVNTPVGFSNGSVTHVVKVNLTDFHGADPAASGRTSGLLYYLPLDTPSDGMRYLIANGSFTMRLPTGRYFLAYSAYTNNSPEGTEATALVVRDEVVVDHDLALDFDSRTTREILVDTPDPTSAQMSNLGLHRTNALGQTASLETGAGVWEQHTYLNAVPKPTVGKLEATFVTTRIRSQLDLTVGDLALTPEYLIPSGGGSAEFPELLKMISGRHRYGLVAIGDGTAADLAGRDLRGKLVLVRQPEAFSVDPAVAERVAAAGAAGLIYYGGPAHTARSSGIGGDLLPMVFLSPADGRRLLAELGGREARASVVGTPDTPYGLHLGWTERGPIPAGLRYRVRTDQLARYDTTYHADQRTAYTAGFQLDGWPALPYVESLRAPATRAEYYGPITGRRAVTRFTVKPLVELNISSSRTDTLTRPVRRSDAWFGTPERIAQGDFQSLPDGPAPYLVSREGDTIWFNQQLVDAAGHVNWVPLDRSRYTVRLSRDGTPIAGRTFPLINQATGFDVGAGAGRYRLEVGYTGAGDYRVDTRWDFSSRPAEGAPAAGFTCGNRYGVVPGAPACNAQPAIDLDYDLGTGATNTVRGVSPISVRASHVPGAGSAQITGVRAWISYDEGARWRPVDLHGRDWRTAWVRHPTPGTVSLRVTATDSDRNEVSQTVLNAYRVTR